MEKHGTDSFPMTLGLSKGMICTCESMFTDRMQVGVAVNIIYNQQIKITFYRKITSVQINDLKMSR